MQILHLEMDRDNNIVVDERVKLTVRALAGQIILSAGAVIDINQDAYRYDEHFVFRNGITGLSGKVTVAVSSSTEPLNHEDFKLLVKDAVDAFEILGLLRTELRLQSLPLLCQAGTDYPAGAGRAIALSDVIRWHRAQISHFTQERARMKRWSDEHDGDHPGAAYEKYADQIEHHEFMISRIAEMTC